MVGNELRIEDVERLGCPQETVATDGDFITPDSKASEIDNKVAFEPTSNHRSN